MHPDFLGALLALLEICGIDQFIKSLPEIIGKLNKILESPLILLNATKYEAAKLHCLLAQNLHKAADVVVSYYWPDVSRCLQIAMKDRVIKVSVAASEAMNEWLKLKETYENFEDRKITIDKISNNKKQQIHKPRPIKKTEEIIPATWGSAARAAKFLRKKDGIGGGNVGQKIVNKSQIKAHEELNNFQVFQRITEEPMLPNNKEIIPHDSIVSKNIEEQKSSNRQRYTKYTHHQPLRAFDEKIEALSIDQEDDDKIINSEEPKRSYIYPPQSLINTEQTMRISNIPKAVDITKNIPTEQLPNATAYWIEATKKVQLGNIEEGYKSVLASEDDLYLLRIMMSTGPVSLSDNTTETVLTKANEIVRSNCIPKLMLNWIKEAMNNGSFYTFKKQLQNELLDTIYELSKSNSNLGSEAKELYEKIIIHIKERNKL